MFEHESCTNAMICTKFVVSISCRAHSLLCVRVCIHIYIIEVFRSTLYTNTAIYQFHLAQKKKEVKLTHLLKREDNNHEQLQDPKHDFPFGVCWVAISLGTFTNKNLSI